MGIMRVIVILETFTIDHYDDGGGSGDVLRARARACDREGGRSGSSVCPPWTQICDRLTGRTGDGPETIASPRPFRGKFQYSSQLDQKLFVLSLWPCILCCCSLRRSGWLKIRPSFPSFGIWELRFSVWLLFGTWHLKHFSISLWCSSILSIK